MQFQKSKILLAITAISFLAAGCLNKQSGPILSIQAHPGVNNYAPPVPYGAKTQVSTTLQYNIVPINSDVELDQAIETTITLTKPDGKQLENKITINACSNFLRIYFGTTCHLDSYGQQFLFSSINGAISSQYVYGGDTNNVLDEIGNYKLDSSNPLIQGIQFNYNPNTNTVQ